MIDHLTIPVAFNDWGLSFVSGNILVREALSLPVSLLLGLCVNMLMLFIWVLQLCTYTSWMHAVQKAAEKLCWTTFPFLLSCCKASAIGLLCRLPDSHSRPAMHHALQAFCSTLISVTHYRCLRYVIDDPLLLQSSVKHDSLDLFINSFLGMTPTVWSTIPLSLRER